MELFPYEMTAWQLNQVYEKIKNCRVVSPPYDIDGFYSAEFFLDKRFWLDEFYSDPDKTFIDSIEISWITYFYYTKTVLWVITWYIWAINEWWEFKVITPTWFILSENSPKKMVYGKWLKGAKAWSITITEYAEIDWRPAFKYTWTSLTVWDYIIFNKLWNELDWVVSRIEYIDTWTWFVQISNTDSKGSAILVWDTADRYDWTVTIWSQTILIWHTDSSWYWNISLVVLDWYNEWNVILLKQDIHQEIVDIINFDWNIFALTEYNIYYSDFWFYSNTKFWILQKFSIDWWYRLFNLWEALLLFARQNKLYAAVSSTWDTKLWYMPYDVSYNGDLFSKYSTIFADQTIYILQKDLQLMQVDTKKVNISSYELTVKNVLLNSRWIFYWFKWWEISIHSSTKFLNFLYHKDGDTINYQFDKQYQHWIINEYQWKIIYKIDDEWKVLWTWKIYNETWYTDDWVEYNQEVNYSLNWSQKMYLPYIVRTLFWIKDLEWPLPKVDLDLIIQFDLWWRMEELNKKLNNFDFDSRLNEITFTADELIWSDTIISEQNEFNWTIVSLQSNILKTWRFIRFKYNSINRFCIWPSYVLADSTKAFINEINTTN